MTILQSLILGIVEGVTEFLPISSTGHLILAGELLKIGQSNFAKSFEIIIQLGAIFSVVVLYWKSFLHIENLKKLVVAFIPTGIIGLALYKVVKKQLIGNQSVVLWALILGGAALIIFEFWHKESEETTDSIARVSYKQSLCIGLCQSIAIIPGVSRSAATIIGGLLAGLTRKTIVEFSFLLAVPTMLAASGLDLLKNADSFSKNQLGVLAVGFVVSFVTAMVSIKFLLSFIKKHNFIPFGIYRILLTLVFWLTVLRWQ
jgi:undecaprenyl-diphosphatase